MIAALDVTVGTWRSLGSTTRLQSSHSDGTWVRSTGGSRAEREALDAGKGASAHPGRRAADRRSLGRLIDGER